MTLDVLPFYKLLLFTRNSFFPNSKAIQYLVPQHQQTGLFHLFLCQVPSDFYHLSVYTNSATKSHSFPNLPINFIHLFFFPLLILIILSTFFLSFFTTLSQKNVQKGAPASAAHPPVPQHCVFRREGLRSHPCHLGFTLCGWKPVGGCPLSTLVLTAAGFIFAKTWVEKELGEQWEPLTGDNWAQQVRPQ